MSQLNLQNIIEIFKEYSTLKRASLDILLVGGLALHHYGMKDRATMDVDAEVRGDIEGLIDYLKSKHIPADMGEDFPDGLWC